MNLTRGVCGAMILAAAFTGCKKSSGGPTTPGPSGSSVSGKVTDSLSGTGIAGATLRVDGVGQTTTDADGTFSLGTPADVASRSATISSASSVDRVTFVSTPGSAGTLTLIPSSFDLAAFDQMFRGNQSALRRWTTAPALIIQKRTLTFSTTSDAVSVAGTPLLSDDEVNQFFADLTFALPLLTGNTFTAFASQSTEAATPGDIVQVIRSNAVFVARYTGLTAGTGFAGYTRWTWNGKGEVILGTMMLDQNYDVSNVPTRRALRGHELGHALSYNHVTSRTSIMNPTPVVDPNPFDRDGAKIAFQRPPLNRTPDNDQNPATITTLSAGQLFTAGAP